MRRCFSKKEVLTREVEHLHIDQVGLGESKVGGDDPSLIPVQIFDFHLHDENEIEKDTLKPGGEQAKIIGNPFSIAPSLSIKSGEL